jgi:type II secretory pathway pseudopilin PulG
MNTERAVSTGFEGFAMLALLIVVALMGLALTSASAVWSTQSKRDKEAELLHIGGEFKRAIESYVKSSSGAPQYPLALEDLVKDPRFPNVKRHLRRIYIDPLTGKTEWGLVKLGDAVIGVYSIASGTPLKTANLGEEVSTTESVNSYADWKFVYRAEDGAVRAGSSTGGGRGGNADSGSEAPEPDEHAPPKPGRYLPGINPGNNAACQAALAEQYKHCAEISDVDERAACLQSAVAAHQQCIQQQ